MNDDIYFLVLNNADPNAYINKLKDENSALNMVKLIRNEHLKFISLVLTTLFYHATNPKSDSIML